METNLMMVDIQDTPQTWWEIDCTYDGKRSWALASGENQLQAEANFRAPLADPELTVVTRIKLLGESTAVEAVASGRGCDA
jgi:hypothetical protein